ncbi:MAG: hypothetical protein K2Y08_04470 [Alphaproteobacteria bacterium]|nr:hypothetical protein [Alphaproteobacteria bacterium]
MSEGGFFSTENTPLGKEFSRTIFKKTHRIQKTNSIKDRCHDHNYLSLIKDPLWKSVCSEMTDLMGPSPIQKMRDSKLGAFCSESKSINLCCPTDEAAQFVNQYSFLILGSLQRYFPAIKTLKTKVVHVNLGVRQ